MNKWKYSLYFLTTGIQISPNTKQFYLELGPKAIAQFKKYHPLKSSISYTNPYQTTAILKTFINVNKPAELTEITNWLLFLGGDIKVREVPEEVLESLQERLCLYCP
jgi:hypothetical protein